MQDVELACLLQDSRQQRSAVLRVEQVDDQRDHCVAVLVAERLQRGLVAVDHHHARACRQHRLGASQSDARRSPRHDSNLVLQLHCRFPRLYCCHSADRWWIRLRRFYHSWDPTNSSHALAKDLYDFALCIATISDLYCLVRNGIQVARDLKRLIPWRPRGRLDATAVAIRTPRP